MLQEELHCFHATAVRRAVQWGSAVLQVTKSHGVQIIRRTDVAANTSTEPLAICNTHHSERVDRGALLQELREHKNIAAYAGHVNGPVGGLDMRDLGMRSRLCRTLRGIQLPLAHLRNWSGRHGGQPERLLTVAIRRRLFGGGREKAVFERLGHSKIQRLNTTRIRGDCKRGNLAKGWRRLVQRE